MFSSSLGTEQGNSGELGMRDDGGSCLEPFWMDAFFNDTKRYRRKLDPNATESQPRMEYAADILFVCWILYIRLTFDFR